MKGMSLSPERHRNNNTNAPKAPTFNIPLRFAGGFSGHDCQCHILPAVNVAAPLQKPVPLPPPVDFVEPTFDDIMLRGVPDPNSPSPAPRVNPWSADYFLGNITTL